LVKTVSCIGFQLASNLALYSSVSLLSHHHTVCMRKELLTEFSHGNGKGTIAMKVLGSGAAPLIRRHQSTTKAIAQLRYIDAMIIGMKNIEVRKNVQAILSGQK
jgi:hypothetical protein